MNAKRFNYGASQLDPAKNSLQGSFLMSTERLNGSPFEKAVVLLMQDDKRGTFGVALNKIANEQVRSAWQKLTGTSHNDAVSYTHLTLPTTPYV